MPKNKKNTPLSYAGVMVSSSFSDLKRHRAALIEALTHRGFCPVAMENGRVLPVDLIESSLRMVRDAAAYMLVIGYKYGQVPASIDRNPYGVSLTELEFKEAQRLGRPIYLFIMEGHMALPEDMEDIPANKVKLENFRERAKMYVAGCETAVSRVYTPFHSPEDFSKKAITAVADLAIYLQGLDADSESVPDPTVADSDSIPVPPAFYAEPPYIASGNFVGRQAELEKLSEWAKPADSYPVLLLEAIGGTGKSSLTWEWTTKKSSVVRPDWAGRFWYSFYETDATMLDFSRRALSYMTSKPYGAFREKDAAELKVLLIHQLRLKPWLLILDGLERVLVWYHRFDAAQVRDEEVGKTDKIAHRNPCDAINPADDELLHALAGAAPSKLLLTSRLIPQVFLDRSNQVISGVLCVGLHGLRPVDAEALIRACGVRGTASRIQNYLQTHCDGHPLVIGVLAGLINDFFPDRGNFDAWEHDPEGGGRLNFANLDLKQKRNHILDMALAALSESSRQLLATLALFSGSVDYPTLCALNPSLPPIPEAAPEPKSPEFWPTWDKLKENQRVTALLNYNAALQRHNEYKQALTKREQEMKSLTTGLSSAVKDLEARGLLQYDSAARHYNLHPVVRGIAAGGLEPEEMKRYGKLVVDHFSQQAQNPYDQAKSIEEFNTPRHIINVLFLMGKFEPALRFIFDKNFIKTLNVRFEAHNEILTIIRPFFPNGWGEIPEFLGKRRGLKLAARAAVSLRRIGAYQDAFDISETALRFVLKQNSVKGKSVCTQLSCLASTAGEQGHLAQEDRLLALAYDDAATFGSEANLVNVLLARFRQLSVIGKWAEALNVWSRLNAMPHNVGIIAAHHYAVHLFLCDKLTEEELSKAEDLNRDSESALGIRNLCALRGFWQLDFNNNFEVAKKSLQEAIALARKAGKSDLRSEIRLAVARCRLGELTDARQVADQFSSQVEDSCQRALADLWFAIGDRGQAKKYALAAYKWAWADGEPYVRRYELNKTSALLALLGVAIPSLPLYDPAKHAKFSWEDEVLAAKNKFKDNKDVRS